MRVIGFLWALSVLSPTSGFHARRGGSAAFRRLHVDASVSGNGWKERADNLFAENTDQRPVILFDGVCNLCNGGVNVALDLDPEGKFRFAALQSQTGKDLLQRAGRRPDDISSIVLVDSERAYVKSDAVLRIARELANPFPFMGWVGLKFPRFGRDYVYDFVASNRYNFFGRTNSCRVSDERFESRFIPDQQALSDAKAT